MSLKSWINHDDPAVKVITCLLMLDPDSDLQRPQLRIYIETEDPSEICSKYAPVKLKTNQLNNFV